MSWRARLNAIGQDCRTDGWDSYGAAPVTQPALTAAAVLCDSLDVVPTSRGGIQISFAAEAISIEIDGNGHVFAISLDSFDAESFVALTAEGET